jgi:hypothetical protein
MAEVGSRFRRHCALFQVYLAQVARLNEILWMDIVSAVFPTLGEQG